MDPRRKLRADYAVKISLLIFFALLCSYSSVLPLDLWLQARKLITWAENKERT
jgi:hypothetical protein